MAQTGFASTLDFCQTHVMVDPGGRPSAGQVAMRRRQRRLRSMLRHVRMALPRLPTTAQRQKTARAREEGHEEKHNAPRRQKPPPLPSPSQRPQRADAESQTDIKQSSRSSSRRSAIPSIVEHAEDAPVPQAMEGIVEFDYMAPRLPPPGGGGQANMRRPRLPPPIQHLLK